MPSNQYYDLALLLARVQAEEVVPDYAFDEDRIEHVEPFQCSYCAAEYIDLTDYPYCSAECAIYAEAEDHADDR